ncbi:MAG TPA: hypothetical protein VFT43_15495 [Candidatus Polarisedimenticolia bacterium]|nr:hypothetical protein [Candidatus Polarisedimenticolia bacterium]
MGASRSVDIFIDPNPNCPDGCGQRFLAVGDPRPVTRLRYWSGAEISIDCDVTGWSSAGGGTPCEAQAVTVEDSGAGVSTLVYGGDWGLRLMPRDGSAPFGEPYLLVDDDSLIG